MLAVLQPVRIAAALEVGGILVLFLVSMPGAVSNWRETRVKGGTAYHIAFGRMLRLLTVLLWGAAILWGMVLHWEEPPPLRYFLYIAGAPCGFVSWLLLDRNRWRDG